ncbi:MAG: 50S ribosomal protein L5 [Candidatus Pacearchaeota archaeon]|nr:50S ribosomal protein L5 [Candidatus Pacearchaeota archaeon]
MNKMKEISIEKVVLSIGGTGDNLEKGFKLLKMLTGRKPAKMESRKRIPALGVRPRLEVGAVVTLRKNMDDTLKKMLATRDNTLRKSQISPNNFSFGVKEYIEIPGTEYQRDIGIRGLDVTVVFKRSGKRVRLRKIKEGKIPKRNEISKEEIIKFMEDKFKTNFI